jgi:hypothetical protein
MYDISAEELDSRPLTFSRNRPAIFVSGLYSWVKIKSMRKVRHLLEALGFLAVVSD